MCQRKSLKKVFILIDARHGLKVPAVHFFFVSDNFFDARHGLEVHERECVCVCVYVCLSRVKCASLGVSFFFKKTNLL
jgi:hypothetical protein